MIMKIFSLENDITFAEEYINILQIQDKKLFTNVINSLNDNINNIEDTKERIIILEGDTEIKIEKEKNVPCNPGRQLYRISGIFRSVNAPLQHTAVKL